MGSRFSFGVIVAVVGAAFAVGGCAPAGRVSLVQPQLVGWQREVKLQTEQVLWARAEGIDRVLAEFPLPGARTGRPTYLIYLRFPTDAVRARLDPSAGAKARARGFVIQTRGDFAGLAGFTGGELNIRKPSPLASKDKRHVRVNLTCEDGTQVVGELTATRDDYLVSKFETHRRPADIQALLKPSPAAAATKPKP